MNVMGMIMQQIVAKGPIPDVIRKQGIQGKTTLFQGLLQTEQEITASSDLLSLFEGSVDQENKEELLLLFAGLPGNIANTLLGLLKEDVKDLPESQRTPLINRGLFSQLENLAESNNSNESKNVVFDGQIPPFFVNYDDQQLSITNKQVQEQVAALLKKVDLILSEIEQKDITKVAPTLLTYLEQWRALKKKVINDTNTMTPLPLINKGEGTKEQRLWKELVQVYQNRSQLVSNQQYQTSATVTSADIVKWLQRAIHNQTHTDRATGPPITLSAGSMSQVEQYVIYTGQQVQGSQTVDQQLIEQFQQVMKASKFLAMNNGTSQLSITLRPENLGDMVVKLTQMNGEMAVKIIVSSHAAKEMLDSNIHQLKHMFSPHQVVIERHVVDAQQTQEFTENPEEQSQENSKQDQSGQNKDDHQGDEDFETQFQDLLMNEKV